MRIADLLWLTRARAVRAYGNRGQPRLRCFLEPDAWRGSVKDVYRDLRFSGRARAASFEEAECAFIQKDAYAEWVWRRREAGSRVALSQLPHVSRLLVAKAPLARLIGGRPYALETFVDHHAEPLTGLWVEKPSEGGCGVDIRFLRDPGPWHEPGHVLQRYLDAPLLIDSRKFDVRVLARIDDRGTIRIHREGLIRLADRPFDTTSLDPLIHNSNASFQQREGIGRERTHFLSELPNGRDAAKRIAEIVDDLGRLLREADAFEGSADFELLAIDFLIERCTPRPRRAGDPTRSGVQVDPDRRSEQRASPEAGGARAAATRARRSHGRRRRT